MKALSGFAPLLFALLVALPCQAREVPPDTAEAEPPNALLLLSYHHGHSWEDDILHAFEARNGTLADRPVLHVVNALPWRNIPIVFSGINGDPAELVGERGRTISGSGLDLGHLPLVH